MKKEKTNQAESLAVDYGHKYEVIFSLKKTTFYVKMAKILIKEICSEGILSNKLVISELVNQ